MKKYINILTVMIVSMCLLTGCVTETNEKKDIALAENTILTETGEVYVKGQPTEKPLAESPKEEEINKIGETKQTGEVKEPGMSNDASMDTQMPEQETAQEAEPEESRLQLVFLGDSIFDAHRDGTGIPELTADQCDANVYNLAIAGTSATMEEGERRESELWTSRSLSGIVKAMMGEISTDIFEGTDAKKLLDDPNIDFTKTDYFVVEYGINDYFRAVPLDNLDETYDLFTYVGALRYAVTSLRDVAPDATIIMCSPHYCQFFDNNQYLGDGNILHNGQGTLFDYKGKCLYVAREQQTESLDAYLDLGINGYTAKDYLEDGVHLTEAGRQLYADALAKKILKYEETKNN